MSINDNDLWLKDIDKAIEILPEMYELSGKRIMITGCTGLICSAITDVLIRWNQKHDEKIRIIAACRNAEKVHSRFSPFDSEQWFDSVHYDAISTENELPLKCDYIIHGASNSTPKMIAREPVETMLSNFLGVKYLLDYARETDVSRLLYISSSEVYGKKEENRPYQTDDYGYIDLLNPRNSYSVGKRAAETLCISYAEEYGVESVIVRPGHIYGPTSSENDNRVSSAWIHSASRGQDIIIKSDGSQVRSYCYCVDCASAVLKVLIKGEKRHAYNISNPESVISIRELAETIVKKSDVKLKRKTPDEEEKLSFNPMNNSSLDGTELTKLGWQPLFDIGIGISHTIEILKNT